MSPFFEELERQLHAAAESRVRERAGRSRRVPALIGRALGAAPLVAAVAIAAAVAVVALVALGHDGPRPSASHPAPILKPVPVGTPAELRLLFGSHPPPHLLQELGYIEAANRRLLSSRSCRVAQPTGVTYAHGSPSRALLSVLAVLRRPATSRDRVPAHFLAGQPSVYRGRGRLARVVGGESYFVVPVHQSASYSSPPARCFTLEVAALRKALPSIPAPLRAPTAHLQARLLAWARRTLDHSVDAICLVTVGRGGNGSGCVITAAEIDGGSPPQEQNGTYYGIVPDGVASVTLRLQTRPNAPTATGSVVNNVYAIRAPHFHGAAAALLVWRAADGHVIKAFPAETPAAARRQFCAAHELACISLLTLQSAQSGGAASASSSRSASTSSSTTASATSTTTR